MPYDTLIALCIYALVTSVSPGPSNFMLLASGVNFGFARTIPQVLGITAGFTSLLLGMGLGLGAVLVAFPALHVVLRVAGGAYLLWLAWRIGTSRSLSANANSETRPLRFVDSALFQWVNPKAWVVAMTAMSVYIDDNAPLRSVLLICLVFALVNLPGVAVWAAFGVSLRRFLSDPARLKYFNICMGLLLATTLWPMLM
jgi:threonine/homoserine/homoserine lactone efflux protein